MDRQQAIRWIAHRMKNKKTYTDFDMSFISHYLKVILNEDVSPMQVRTDIRRVSFNPKRNLGLYIKNMMEHVCDHYKINFVFKKNTLLYIY